MTLFIDPPSWPAHGTHFSHLISDTTLDELHEIAQAAGLNPRAFDGDHYDVPAHLHPVLVELGALPVTGNELTRRLIASGLRIRAVDRPQRRAVVLTHRWNTLIPGYPAIGADLIARWSEPHRRYHDTAHLIACLNALGTLDRLGASLGPTPRAVMLAAWFHDAVYEGQPGEDEEHSAQLAEHALAATDLSTHEIDEVARLVRVTATHSPESDDAAAAALCDADLSILGSSPEAYAQYVENVRAEYAHLDDAAFTSGRYDVVRRLLERQPLFATATGRELWEEVARVNMRAELERLEAARAS